MPCSAQWTPSIPTVERCSKLGDCSSRRTGRPQLVADAVELPTWSTAACSAEAYPAEVYVAPLIASTCPSAWLRALSWSELPTCALICCECGSFAGSATFSTAVILPSVNVTFRVTSPYCVAAEVVTVFVPVLLAGSVLELLLEVSLLDVESLLDVSLAVEPVSVLPEAALAVPVSVDETAAVAVVLGSWALKPRVPASPTAVAARTMGARFMPPASMGWVNAPRGLAGSSLSARSHAETRESPHGTVPAVIGEAPAVRIATRDDRAVTSEMLARAFAADPLLTWVFDRVGRRPAASARFFSWYLDLLVDQGTCWVESSIRGAALWALPGQWAASAGGHVRLTLATALAVRHPIRVLRGLGELELAHPKEPHLYLAVLGADPSAQGQGVGSALLRAGLQLADEERWPAYLETATERNVALYGRFGFEVTRRVDMPGGGPPVWLMWREPS